MALNILVLAETGELAYISKHNTNYANIKAAIDALQSAIGAGSSGGATLSVAYEGIFGAANCIVGYGSYLPSDSVTAHELTVAGGYAYDEPTDAVVVKSSTTTLSFSGQTTGTYYVHVDGTGEPYYDANASGALYSVHYDQSTGDFDTVTRVGNLFEAAADQENSRTNLWSISYATTDERMNGIERASFYVLKKTAEGDDLTVTDKEAFEQSIILIEDGPQTDDLTLNIPAAERVYTIVNDGSATYSIEVLPDSGTGYTVPGKYFAVLHCDGSTVEPIFLLDRTSGSSPVSDFLSLSDTPATFSGQTLKSVRVNAGETALEFFTLSVTGDVVGPGSSTDSAIALFDGATGKLIKDSGTTLGDLAGGGDVTGPGSATDSAIALFDGATGKLLKDSTVTLAGFAATGLFFPSTFVVGKPEASQLILAIAPPGGVVVTIPAGMTSSKFIAKTAATAQTDFDIQKNGSSAGTITFAASGTVATYSVTNPVVLDGDSNDYLEVYAPASQDATLADLMLTIYATRS